MSFSVSSAAAMGAVMAIALGSGDEASFPLVWVSALAGAGAVIALPCPGYEAEALLDAVGQVHPGLPVAFYRENGPAREAVRRMPTTASGRYRRNQMARRCRWKAR